MIYGNNKSLFVIYGDNKSLFVTFPEKEIVCDWSSHWVSRVLFWGGKTFKRFVYDFSCKKLFHDL